ncbi:hypothetical protein GS399_17720 [Pedobacter sp. HMF7647]|uniref:O-antigen polysaccharide polymerase Wzy n=1 Tax=Hufsiella arboris TaxID=2695275 RepID=A0A7K1YDY0_9SPHI|nr:hypothetical protein [Hufsiella arboris]MXV52814.1 hypothetical protein [Hufsiella arboris]
MNKDNSNPLKYLILYFPFILALLLMDFPNASYLTAWMGSFYIFYISFTGKLKKLPTDLPAEQQLLRPFLLTHIIFAGYMACTSIFYYMNTLGYEYFTYVGTEYDTTGALADIARCQRYYVLGHAALAHGLISAMSYPIENKYSLHVDSMSNFLLKMALLSLPLSYVFRSVGALSQFSVQATGLSFVAGTLSLAYSLRENRKGNTVVSAGLFVLNFLQALISGFKEPIIVSVLLLGIFLIPLYGKKVYPVFGAALIALFVVLPTFIAVFRQSAFSGESSQLARDKALDAVFNNENLQQDIRKDNWAFLTSRISEIEMFTQFAKSTPQQVPFYHFSLLKQSAEAIIPRAIWLSKPVTEELVMQRVYAAGVVSEDAVVSAKPAYIVDCYLSGGMIGVWVGLFLYGFLAQKISIKAESIFGGYFLGTAVMFTGLFQIFWRGNSFEFIFNAIFWSYISMFLVFYALKSFGIIVKR